MKPLNESRVMIHQINDFVLDRIRIIKSEGGYVAHLHIDGDIFVLITQKNEIRKFKTIDAAFNVLRVYCESQCVPFEVRRSLAA